MTDPSAGPSSPSTAELAAAEEIAALFVTSGQTRKYAATRILLHLEPLVRSVEERVLEDVMSKTRCLTGDYTHEDCMLAYVRSRLAALKETRER